MVRLLFWILQRSWRGECRIHRITDPSKCNRCAAKMLSDLEAAGETAGESLSELAVHSDQMKRGSGD